MLIVIQIHIFLNSYFKSIPINWDIDNFKKIQNQEKLDSI